MLHEVLLALSGHPSPLFPDPAHPGAKDLSDDVPLLSRSEQALLQSLGRLSHLHRQLQQHADWLVAHHPSTICRAVASSIRNSHLASFQQKIVDVESRILTKDAGIVGAYDIVPLAGVAAEFEEWHRRMEWYWTVAEFMQTRDSHVEGASGAPSCSGAALIDRLRADAQTGFSDIEQAAIDLSKAAETAWLRQVASWAVYGKLPVFGATDFFVRGEASSEDGKPAFTKDSSLLPKFVSQSMASSILFIGKSLHQLQLLGKSNTQPHGVTSTGSDSRRLAMSHLQQLADLTLPLVPSQLARAVSEIRSSLSKNVLQQLIPLDNTLRLLASLRQFFLLDNGEFAVALISEAEKRLQARWQSMGRLLQQDPVKALRGLSIKDTELSQALTQTWKVLASNEDVENDHVLDFARKHVVISAQKAARSRPVTSDSPSATMIKPSSVAFNDLLFPTPTNLTMMVPSPFDLFVSQAEIDSYTTIHSYLLALRRAHMRLTDLWRRSSARRHHPAPAGPAHSSSDSVRAKLAEDGERTMIRAKAARKIWASCSAAVFLLAESAAYFEGEVIRGSWTKFEAWVKAPNINQDAPATANDRKQTGGHEQHDPETLAAGHRAFISALIYALLLTDTAYTKEMRSLLGNIDNLIALFDRLLEVQQKLDLEREAGAESLLGKEDEQKITLELDRARNRVDSDLKSVVNRLRQLDHERIGSGRFLDLAGIDAGGFEPWQGGGVDRLLMKLEFGRLSAETFDLV